MYLVRLRIYPRKLDLKGPLFSAAFSFVPLKYSWFWTPGGAGGSTVVLIQGALYRKGSQAEPLDGLSPASGPPEPHRGPGDST